MKKSLCICLALCLIFGFLSSCATEDTRVSYKFDRSDIVKIEGKKQMLVVALSNEQGDMLLDMIEALNPKETGVRNDKKGWSFIFTVYYRDGRQTVITFISNTLLIDRYVYETDPYDFLDFSVFFD